ncbi:MAG: hypothetical protein ACOYW9_09970 [Deinococcota bacterium]
MALSDPVLIVVIPALITLVGGLVNRWLDSRDRRREAMRKDQADLNDDLWRMLEDARKEGERQRLIAEEFRAKWLESQEQIIELRGKLMQLEARVRELEARAG